MAIDANVLINERIREELRNGSTPQAAIHAGYERALATILDSNITTLIAGVALFWLGSGPVRGFAVVLCLGILTSMFSAVMVSRAMVNLTYGRKAQAGQSLDLTAHVDVVGRQVIRQHAGIFPYQTRHPVHELGAGDHRRSRWSPSWSRWRRWGSRA